MARNLHSPDADVMRALYKICMTAAKTKLSACSEQHVGHLLLNAKLYMTVTVVAGKARPPYPYSQQVSCAQVEQAYVGYHIRPAYAARSGQGLLSYL